VTVLKLFWGKCCCPPFIEKLHRVRIHKSQARLLWLPEFIDEIYRKREYDKEEDYET